LSILICPFGFLSHLFIVKVSITKLNVHWIWTTKTFLASCSECVSKIMSLIDGVVVVLLQLRCT
jgi:hypothetical protein